MAGVLHADGGRVLAEKQAGAYRVVLFGNPLPLRAGQAVPASQGPARNGLLFSAVLGILICIWRGYLKKRRAP